MGLIVAAILKSLVFPGKPKSYQPALRVDLVGLPDLLKKDLSRITPAPPSPSAPEAEEISKPKPKPAPPVMEEADPDEMVMKSSTSKRNRERLKELEKLSKEEAERKRKMESAIQRMKSLAKISEGDAPKPGLLIRGNQISKGTALSGDARESSETSYFDLVRDQLQKNWELPVWLSRQKLSAKVELFIDPKGMIRTFRFTKTSGNPQFDEMVKRALAASQPFPAPPREEAASILLHGISVGFPL